MEKEYLNYLKQLIGGAEGYDILITHLFKREFYSPLEKDKNRAVYGLLLRDRFEAENGLDSNALDYLGVCSVLEIIIALAESVDTFHDTGLTQQQKTTKYFWMMIDNLGLGLLTDNRWDHEASRYFHHKIDIFLDRKYAQNGSGGLFPLQFPNADQTKIELWFQMQSYFLEKNGVFCNSFRG